MARAIASIIAASLALLAVLVATLPALAAQEIPDGQMPAVDDSGALYRSVTVVTGTRIETRLPGFAETLGDVLAKVTGDMTIGHESGFARAASTAQDLVLRFSYRDRLAGKPPTEETGESRHGGGVEQTIRVELARLQASLKQKPGIETCRIDPGLAQSLNGETPRLPHGRHGALP